MTTGEFEDTDDPTDCWDDPDAFIVVLRKLTGEIDSVLVLIHDGLEVGTGAYLSAANYQSMADLNRDIGTHLTGHRVVSIEEVNATVTSRKEGPKESFQRPRLRIAGEVENLEVPFGFGIGE